MDLLRRPQREHLVERHDGRAQGPQGLEGAEGRPPVRGVLRQHPQGENPVRELHHGSSDPPRVDLRHKELRPDRRPAHLPAPRSEGLPGDQRAGRRRGGAVLDGGSAREPDDPPGPGPAGRRVVLPRRHEGRQLAEETEAKRRVGPDTPTTPTRVPRRLSSTRSSGPTHWEP